MDDYGATTGLKLEELLAQHNQIAVRTHHIIELRNYEVEQVVIPVNGNEVDLRELWLTSYGYNILSALNMRLDTDLTGLMQIRSAFAEMGFQLKTGKKGHSGVKMKNALKQAIWLIAENKGKKWACIR